MSRSRKPPKTKRKPPNRRRSPRELTEGLAPIRIGLLREDYDEALKLAAADRTAEILRKLEVLRDWYKVPAGPDCWLRLCLAMAAEKYPGFREKAGRKPPKWTMGVHWVLAGEMRRARDGGAATQEQAAQLLASCEPWRKFLAQGQWRSARREPWQNLLHEYTRMRPRYRKFGEHSYVNFRDGGALDKWDSHVRSFLEHPA